MRLDGAGVIHLTSNGDNIGWNVWTLCGQNTATLGATGWRYVDDAVLTCLFCVVEEPRWRRG